MPAGFCFAFKASLYLTHMRKFREPTDPLRRIVEHATWLGDQLGLILFQLPPGWQRNVERLLSFIDQLPLQLSHAIEFRDPSWYDSTVFDAMAERSVALCLHDMPGSASPRVAVGPFRVRPVPRRGDEVRRWVSLAHLARLGRLARGDDLDREGYLRLFQQRRRRTLAT